jgi:hypothetical protein
MKAHRSFETEKLVERFLQLTFGKHLKIVSFSIDLLQV